MLAAKMKNFARNLLKKLPLIAISTLIVGLCLYFTFRHYSHFGQKTDLISNLETALLDFRFGKRGIKKPNNKIGILAIDEKSIEQFGRWPISRKYYKKALLNLKSLGVSWVGFDAVFSEAEKPTIEDITSEIKKLSKADKNNWQSSINSSLNKIQTYNKIGPGDKALSEALEEFENIVLGYFYFQSKREVELGGRSDIAYRGLDEMSDDAIQAYILPDGKELSDYPNYMQAYGLVANTPDITKSGSYYAFFSNEADNDAIVRWVTLVRIIDGNLMPSLSLKLAAEAMNRDILVIFEDNGIDSIELINREDESDALSIPLDPYGQGRGLANYRGPGQTFPHFSLADAYNNSFTDEEREALKGSILLLGMTAIGINDQRPNPFDPAFDGVEIHATMVDNIMSQDLMRRPKSIFKLELLILLCIGLIFSPILIFSRATYSALIGLIFSICYYYYDSYHWFNHGIWAYMGMPYIEIFSLFIFITLYKYATEEKEKRKIKGAFSLYLSSDVIDQVLDEPDALQLGGVRKDITVFFSDVRGFTTISESLSPEQLCDFMNQYFTPMTNIILHHKGVLDKYIGDAIMAFWGAPIPLVEQADIAVDASIEMLVALDKLQTDFKAKGYPNCDIGIGLNSGPMSVGNMGSDERFCYTVMGDSVNLGARLEGLTKEYGIKLLVSEFTIAKLTKPHHLYRDLDDIRVKGKNEPVKVFHVLRPDLLPNEQHIKELIGHFEEGRTLYRAQDWLKAQSKFNEVLKISANDGPALMYLKRIEDYKTKPLIENWDGVYTFTHK